MVGRLAILAIWAMALSAHATQVNLQMEFSKEEIYEGEHTLVNFVLYSQSSGVEVEVAKFPEFRGFWSENLALRQGPLPLSPQFERPGWYKTIIGSYLLTSMVGQKSPQIVPMKLVLKSTNRFMPTDEEERVLVSTGSPPRILPLPPLQDPIFEKENFRGAVGSFVLTAQDETLLYQKSEPILLRVLLQGEGNFREINELPLTLPEGVEVLSQNAYAKGAGQYYTKTFEYTLAVHREEDLVLPPVTLIYFHPRLASYQQLQTVPIRLRFEPTPPVTLGELSAPAEGLLSEWTAFRPLDRTPWFWAVQLVLLLLWGGRSALAGVRAVLFRVRTRPRRPNHKMELKDLSEELQAGDVVNFMRGSEALAQQILRSRLASGPKGPPPTRSQALRDAAIPDQIREPLKALFAEHDRFLYSREKTPPANPATHLESLKGLVRAR